MDPGVVHASVKHLVQQTGAYIRDEKAGFNASSTEQKALHDLVSYVDRTSEEKLVTGLRKIIPGASFLAEEQGVIDPGNAYTWIIDPLDGTTNFIHGIPHFCISIGLQYEDRTIAGWVYEVNSDELFHAFENGGAYLNGLPVWVSKASALSSSLIATGFPVNKYGRLEGYMQLLETLIRNSHGIRRLGTAALDLCYVACGRVEAFYEYGLNPWDVAAGALIVREAGGSVTGFSGDENYLFGEEILATNGYIHEELLLHVKKTMQKI